MEAIIFLRNNSEMLAECAPLYPSQSRSSEKCFVSEITHSKSECTLTLNHVKQISLDLLPANFNICSP
jgi:hypothetical protein